MNDATLVLTIAYDGAPFAGFARQPGQCTVQGEIERALETMLRREALTTCAGRTDAGVHALGQQVSVPVEMSELEGRSLERLTRSLNALTPETIVIREARIEHEGFSARMDAISREYRYRIVCSPTPPLFLRACTWWVRGNGLNVSAMEAAAQYLVGEHDFKSFCAAVSAQDKPTCRRVDTIEFFYEEHLGEQCLTMRVVGNAFLHNMIRVMTGTLVEVGLGHRDPSWVASVLAACDRRAAAQTAPPQGLTFWKVEYGTRQ